MFEADGGEGVDGGGDALSTAAAAVCVGGGRLMEVTGKRSLTEVMAVIEADGSDGGDGGGRALATAAAAVCVGGGRLTEVSDGGEETVDGGNGLYRGDGGGDDLATAAAAVCVVGGGLAEATGKRCLTEADVSDGGDEGEVSEVM